MQIGGRRSKKKKLRATFHNTRKLHSPVPLCKYGRNNDPAMRTFLNQLLRSQSAKRSMAIAGSWEPAPSTAGNTGQTIHHRGPSSQTRTLIAGCFQLASLSARLSVLPFGRAPLFLPNASCGLPFRMCLFPFQHNMPRTLIQSPVTLCLFFFCVFF